MKLYLSAILSVILILCACNNDDNNPENIAGNGEITSTVLPKGQYVIKDEYTNNPVNQGGSLNGKNTDTATATNGNNKELDVKRRFKNLLVFHAEDTMKIKKAYIATLVLGKDQLFGDLKEIATENSKSNKPKTYQDTTVELGSKMRAKLSDGSGATDKGFDIELFGEDAAEQNLSDKRKRLNWQWKITPLTPGEQHLTLSITITEKDGEKVNLPVKDIAIVIFAEKDFWGSVGSFFKDDSTKWILTGLLIPIFIAWFSARMRHKFDSRSQKDREEKERAVTAKENTTPATAPTQSAQGTETTT